MYDITLEDIIRTGRDQSMRISVESTPGFNGDRQVTVTYNQYCHKQSVVRSIVSELFDAGDKVTIFGDIQIRKRDDSEAYDAFLNYSVDPDSITIRKDLEETDETGSSSTPVQ
ncbi:hypothetical protein JA33_154 [Dickeya phage vB_DsoM_JA33]|uniref:Uncharacterized protein n=3 Tax=Salmondvirus JA11 TaxID=2734141 RepID=A0A384ZWD6_9CAUD|nr:hypothetical protein HOU32_gp154 [Dickeya phage vB_DsoM_JA11]AXG66558.1 hypothetical protein JA13_155 [Dickeya phage vB_DsoM_JA13]AXG67528.1 hypothetical protein JA33_154 [Dickeya phage vB_DsoM_JA33]AYD79959.1 hypothetical protein JA11_154 [Dickeya phage vB_DsoM_JA11]